MRTRRSARVDDWSGVDSVPATLLRDELDVRSSVGAPITVADELWGIIAVHSKTRVLPPDTEARLERFAALVVTSLSDAQARQEVRRLADEQAALRRVATLVAQGSQPAAVFDAVTREVADLVGSSSVTLARYD